ncbi:MAG: hypothetical protein ACP5N7_03390 [Candidatus Pacearchaeota archaeon]
MSLRKSAIITSSIVALATSVSVPVSRYLYDQREKAIARITENIRNFDGNPEISERDWEILYMKLGEGYAKHGTHLKALYEIEERLPQIMEEMRR